jgi:hypothetical protein
LDQINDSNVWDCSKFDGNTMAILMLSWFCILVILAKSEDTIVPMNDQRKIAFEVIHLQLPFPGTIKALLIQSCYKRLDSVHNKQFAANRAKSIGNCSRNS